MHYQGSPLSRAPLHQHRRDEGQSREEDPEEEERQTSMEDIDYLYLKGVYL